MGFGDASAMLGQAIGPRKLERIFYDPTIQAEIPGLTEYLRNFRTADVGALGEYETALRGLSPQIRALGQEDIGNLGTLIGRNLNYDPLAGYERLRTGNLAALGDWASILGGMGAASDKSRLAALGYGGRGHGTYENILRTDRISRNITPVLGGIFNNLGREAASADQSRLNNILATLGLTNERAGIPYRSIDDILAPVRARGTTAASTLANFGNLGTIARQNVAGFQEKKSPWELALGSLGSTADAGIDAYASLYGLGGFGGFGGGSRGSGGSVDLNAILQMLGRQYTPPNTGAGYWYGGQNYIPGVNAGYPGFN